jgi:hypothetical protein
LIHSSSLSSSVSPNTNSNGGVATSSTPRIGGSDDDITAAIAGGSCARAAANGLAAAREYAFVDCSEVYLAGKQTSGIYEIW